MDKTRVLNYYYNNWIISIDDIMSNADKNIEFNIKYKNHIIKIDITKNLFNWNVNLYPVSDNNILLDKYSLLVWCRDKDYDKYDENPVGLKKHLKGNNWTNTFSIMKKIKKGFKK